MNAEDREQLKLDLLEIHEVLLRGADETFSVITKREYQRLAKACMTAYDEVDITRGS